MCQGSTERGEAELWLVAGLQVGTACSLLPALVWRNGFRGDFFRVVFLPSSVGLPRSSS